MRLVIFLIIFFVTRSLFSLLLATLRRRLGPQPLWVVRSYHSIKIVHLLSAKTVANKLDWIDGAIAKNILWAIGSLPREPGALSLESLQIIAIIPVSDTFRR